MIGARDMAFPRLNSFGFWVTCFGGLLLYFSFLTAPALFGARRRARRGLVRLRAADRAGVFPRATAPTTGSSALIIVGFGSIAGGRQHRHDDSHACATKGMTLGRMPLYAWLNLVVGSA